VPDNLLEIEGLRVHFDTLDGPIEALHSVDLKVEQGQIMGLVGESGCGKSVTSLVTIGLATCDVDEGSVKYEGEELLFRDSQGDKRTQDISGSITVVSVLALILFIFWTVLVNPIQGAILFLISLFITLASSLVGFAAKHEYRRHQKFMRWVRGNEISMIFQEPMTALNPLYTVEKQISEVMRVHDKLVEAETPRYVRVGQALVSPITLIRDAFSSRPQASIAILSVFAFVIAAHMSGFADSAASAVAAPFAFIWSFFVLHQSGPHWRIWGAPLAETFLRRTNDVRPVFRCRIRTRSPSDTPRFRCGFGSLPDALDAALCTPRDGCNRDPPGSARDYIIGLSKTRPRAYSTGNRYP